MKQNKPELASKFKLYQDKCADALASIFIDHKNRSYYHAGNIRYSENIH